MKITKLWKLGSAVALALVSKGLLPQAAKAGACSNCGPTHNEEVAWECWAWDINRCSLTQWNDVKKNTFYKTHCAGTWNAQLGTYVGDGYRYSHCVISPYADCCGPQYRVPNCPGDNCS